MTRAALTGLVGLMSVMVSYGITNEMTLFDRTCYHSCLLCLLLSRPFGFNVSPGFSLYICSLFLSSYLDLLFYSVSVTVTVVAVSILPVFHLNIIHLFISALVPVFLSAYLPPSWEFLSPHPCVCSQLCLWSFLSCKK